MNTMDIARRMAELNRPEEAQRAYTLALHGGGLTPEEELEAAFYILQSGGDYKVAYTAFLSLYGRGLLRETCLAVMTEAFYQPNAKQLRQRYEKNRALLEKYPYLFRKDFLEFDALPIRFFPYDDEGYVPFYPEGERFGEYVNPADPVISRNFFHDLENPILAKDVYSQYELEYLYDNVRKSEDVARENHVYLHYASWGEFCAHLQVWNLRRVLEDKKIVFLIEEEESEYPIDFQARFGVDYSRLTPRPIGVRDVRRLIWHTQLATHNGGDFFNEIFDDHPNLIPMPSLLLDNTEENIAKIREKLGRANSLEDAVGLLPGIPPRVARELYLLKNPTVRDIITALFLSQTEYVTNLDQNARISPALFFQPHFENVDCELLVDDKGRTVLESAQSEAIHNSAVFKSFKYIKTFTPLRRITTSYGASVRFMFREIREGKEKGDLRTMPDTVCHRVLNRSFMTDPRDRLFRDSVLVRFEDAKLNPRATFSALAAFLDLPYTESMTYCSNGGQRDPESYEGNDIGFSTAAVYRTYDEYATDAERYFIEYFMRDAYEAYGYDFHYYDGQPVDEEKIQALIDGFTTINGFMRQSRQLTEASEEKIIINGQETAWTLEDYIDAVIRNNNENRMKIARTLQKGLYFMSKDGQPLRMMRLLEPDPALLEQPLYR